MKKRAEFIFLTLSSLYKDLKSELNFSNAFELLVATILSAQCTDKRVNIVTEKLFKKYKNVYDFVSLKQEYLEKEIFSVGFYKTKALSIIETSKKICENFNGIVPNNMKDLLSLRGVARKTANIILTDFYKISEGIAVDTHVKRLSNRFDLVNSLNTVIIEKKLMRLFDKKYWAKINHLFVNFGRDRCKAKNPICIDCKFLSFCKFYKDKDIKN